MLFSSFSLSNNLIFQRTTLSLHLNDLIKTFEGLCSTTQSKMFTPHWQSHDSVTTKHFDAIQFKTQSSMLSRIVQDYILVLVVSFTPAAMTAKKKLGKKERA